MVQVLLCNQFLVIKSHNTPSFGFHDLVKLSLKGQSAFVGAQHAAPLRQSHLKFTTCTIGYYPLNAAFTTQAPESPLTDFPHMIAMVGEKPLLLQEVGYPAGEGLGSSEAQQAEFIQAVFDAWDAAGAKIPFLNLFAMGDFSDQMCADFLL